MASNGNLLFLFGDVCGKGLSASLLMSHLHGTFQALAATDSPLDNMVEVASRIFSEKTDLGLFATLVVGRAGRDGSVELISAGHPPFLHLGSVSIRHKQATAQPFGMFVGARFPIHRFCLDSGDALLLYTDGVTECLNSAGQEYGFARLEQAAVRHHPAPPIELIDGCLSDLNTFATGTAPTDDMTMLVIRRTE
jgi:sigma-B regulation protein RsbU (phosphoserine phosphatase)